MKLSKVFAVRLAVVSDISPEGMFTRKIESRKVPGCYIVVKKRQGKTKLLCSGVEVCNDIQNVRSVGDLCITQSVNVGVCIHEKYLSKRKLLELEDRINENELKQEFVEID